MRRLTLCFLFSLSLFSPVFSQNVPNGSFEIWKPILGVDQPVGWFTSSSFAPDSDPRPVVRTQDRQDGESAMQLETVMTNVGGNDQVVQGMAVTGKIDLTKGPIVGFSMMERPEVLRFFYKYQPLFNDSMVIVVTIWKDDYYEPIGVAAFSSHEVQTEFKMVDLVINYYTEEEPDSASIAIFSGVDTARPGSFLVIDNLNFIIKPSGIEPNEPGAEFGMPYPNPAKNQVWFPVNLSSPGKVSLQVADMSGKTVAEEDIRFTSGESGFLFDTGRLKPGFYMYRISSGQGAAQGKLVITE